VSHKSFRAAALDIVATALDLEADDLSSQGGQLEKIKQYILANLPDPELTTERIAHANHIAPRTLNRLFAADGTTPSDGCGSSGCRQASPRWRKDKLAR